MEILLAIICLVWGVLNIILFFKLWRACDNIRRITDKYAPEKDNESQRSRSPETKEGTGRWTNADKYASSRLR